MSGGTAFTLDSLTTLIMGLKLIPMERADFDKFALRHGMDMDLPMEEAWYSEDSEGRMVVLERYGEVLILYVQAPAADAMEVDVSQVVEAKLAFVNAI